MSHTDKYLKYKNKYLELKNQVGGYDTDSLNLPDDLVHSFFKAMLLFLNTILENKVKYFQLLKIAGKIRTYPDMSDLEQIDNFAKNIAKHYNLQIFLPIYVKTFMGSYQVQEKKKWKIITVDKPTVETTVEPKLIDVIILKNQDNDEYNLVNNKLIPYNDSIHSFFKAILLFLNNYLDNNITYFEFLKIVDVDKLDMFVGNKKISDKIYEYAHIIANKYHVTIEIFLIKNINGDTVFVADKNGKIVSIIASPTDIESNLTVMISKDKNKKYNLITTEITKRYDDKKL